MPIKVVRDMPPRAVGVSPLVLCKWALAKLQADKAAEEMKRLRPQISEFFEDVEPDGDGHRWAELPEPIEGVVSVQYQRRVSNKPDMEAVERILKERDLTDRCMKRVVSLSLDEESVMSAMYEGLLSEDDVAQMYPQAVSYAVVCKRG